MFVEGLNACGIVLHCWNVPALSLSTWQVSTAVLSITAKAKKKEKEKKEREEEKMEVVSGNAQPWKTLSTLIANNLTMHLEVGFSRIYDILELHYSSEDRQMPYYT